MMGMRYYNLTNRSENREKSEIHDKPMVIPEEEREEDRDYMETKDNKMEHKLMTKDVVEDVPVNLLSNSINIFATANCFHEKAALKCEKIGLHGFKKMHCFYADYDRKMMLKTQFYIVEMYDEIKDIDWQSINEHTKAHDYSDSVKSMLEAYLEHELETYARIAETANLLVENDFLYEAHLIKDYLHCVTKEIKDCKKYLKDFEMSDWSWHHIRHVDDKLCEKYENKIGYKHNKKDTEVYFSGNMKTD